MRPRYSSDYLDRVYSSNVFDLWALLTTLEKHAPLPERSWLFCRLVEWITATRSGVWTYYESTTEAAQSRVLAALRLYPALRAISEYYERGMGTWRLEQESGNVDDWIESHEKEIHNSLMQIARDDKLLILGLNAEVGVSPMLADTNKDVVIEE